MKFVRSKFHRIRIALILLASLFPLDSSAQAGGLAPRTAVAPFWHGIFPERLLDPGEFVVINAFPHLTFEDPIGLVPKPRSNELWVYGREGVIYAFENSPDTSKATIVLNLRRHTQAWDDCGLLGLVFHPEFGDSSSSNRGFIYVYYQYSPAPIGNAEQRASNVDSAFVSWNRLSRFTVPDGSATVDPSSELILIDQRDRSVWHNGGALFFHPDDHFLYLSLGDEGGSNSVFANDQLIDQGLFSGIIRIDIDQDPARSHPIRRQPRDGQTGHYFVPNDNPFVDPAGKVLEEFWCLGLREPHRMTFDPVSRSVWEGDVGQQRREEINLIEKGGNYQWAYSEGTAPGPKAKPTRIIGVEKPPLYDYTHTRKGTDLRPDNCVIGGYVYRGLEHALQIGGQYIFGDNGSGRIWALQFEVAGDRQTRRVLQLTDIDKVQVRQIAQLPGGSGYSGLSGFGIDQQNELYLCQMGSAGKIYRLAKAPAPTPKDLPPPRLSQTGLFTDVASLQPAPALIPYEVNSPLWSDGAVKTRWIAVPSNETIQYNSTKEWVFPNGTIFVKHFALPVDESNPSVVKRLETRVLVRDVTGAAYGVTYKWREDQTDADLLLQSSQQDIPIRTARGGTTQTWTFPGPRDCLACHNSGAGYVLGVNTYQLNRPFLYSVTGITGNQLRAWNQLALFDSNLTTDWDRFPHLVPLDHPFATLQEKARSYLAANCAQCHRPAGVRAAFDARYSTPLLSQNLIGAPADNDFGLENAALVAAGSPEHSLLLWRINRVGEWQMPPLARNRIDQTAVETITHWMRSLPPITSKRGLFGQYYMGVEFNELRLTRTDSIINFNWGNDSPDNESLPSDNFSVRWTGFVTPEFTERYTFQTISDDGVRLWINGQLLIDDWLDHAPRLASNSIDLTAGVPCGLKLEYYESTEGASISLAWSSPSQPLQIIPASALSSTGTLPRFFPPYLYFSHGVQLTLNAETLGDYEIQSSSNLLDWHPFHQLPAFRGAIAFPQPASSLPTSFFRVVTSNP